MKRLLVISVLTILASPAFANGPMPSDGGTSSSGETSRQKWVRQRSEELKNRREHYENERLRQKLLLTPLDSNASDPIDVMRFKMWEASTQHQRKVESVEELMLKRESGTITPQENAALNKFLRKRARHPQ